MIAIERSVLILLAAGRSTRFAPTGSKLDRTLGEMPLGLHAARALARTPFADRIAVVRIARIDYAAHGFRVVANDDPVGDMASSMRSGVAALADDVHAVLFVLADMPRITATHVGAMFAAARSTGNDMVASSDGLRAMPPALFGRAHFAALRALSGDRGARALLHQAVLVTAAADELMDVDTPTDLDRLRR